MEVTHFLLCGIVVHLEQPTPLTELTEKPTNKNPSGIHKLKCNTCNNVYVGQSGRSINIRHKEHLRYNI